MKKRFGKNVKDVRVRVGESFALELPAQATAGYTWEIVAIPDVLALRTQRIQPAGPAIGAPSTLQLEFTCVLPGKGTLVLEYKRPWETTVAERLAIDIVVDRGD